jgi:hypothetical protein
LTRTASSTNLPPSVRYCSECERRTRVGLEVEGFMTSEIFYLQSRSKA